MIKHVIFDFGCVLVYWSQHNLYDAHFGSKEKTDWFIDHICTWDWNNQTDMGKSFATCVAEKIAEHPEWETEIRMYWERWKDIPNKTTIRRFYLRKRRVLHYSRKWLQIQQVRVLYT